MADVSTIELNGSQVDPFEKMMKAAKIAGGLQAGLSTAQLIAGIVKAANTKRPKYHIPKAVTDMVSMFEARSLATTMPGQEYAEAALETTTANNAARAMTATSPAEAGQLIVQLASGESQGKRSIAANSAAWRDAQTMKLAESKRLLAGYQDKMFDVNEMAPFMDNAAAASALIGSGIQNMNSLANSVVKNMGSSAYLNAMMKMFGEDKEAKLPESNIGKMAGSINMYGPGILDTDFQHQLSPDN